MRHVIHRLPRRGLKVSTITRCRGFLTDDKIDEADKIHAEDDRQPIPDDVDVLEVEWSEEGTSENVCNLFVIPPADIA